MVIHDGVAKFAISFHTLLCVTFHVIGPRRFFSASGFLKPWSVVFLWLQQKSCSLPQYRYWFDTLFECNPNATWSRNVVVGSPRSNVFQWNFSKVGSMFSVLPASLISSTCTDRNSPHARLTNKHSQLKTFPNRVPIDFSNCLFHNSPARGWPYRLDSRGTTGSSILDHDWAICASADVSKYLDILTSEFSITLMNLSFLPEYKRILHLLLVLNIPEALV